MAREPLPPASWKGTKKPLGAVRPIHGATCNGDTAPRISPRCCPQKLPNPPCFLGEQLLPFNQPLHMTSEHSRPGRFLKPCQHTQFLRKQMMTAVAAAVACADHFRGRNFPGIKPSSLTVQGAPVKKARGLVLHRRQDQGSWVALDSRWREELAPGSLFFPVQGRHPESPALQPGQDAPGLGPVFVFIGAGGTGWC